MTLVNNALLISLDCATSKFPSHLSERIVGGTDISTNVASFQAYVNSG